MTKKRRGGDPVVYSSAHGRICPNCGRPTKSCACRLSPHVPQGDGIVRVRRELKGRAGKTVTTVSGIGMPPGELKELAGELKRACGTGGACKSGVIEIQGDHRKTLVEQLEQRGYTVKLAGG